MGSQLLNLARLRRMRFEDTKTDAELELLTFDQYGHALPLYEWVDRASAPLRDRLGELVNVLITANPTLARRLGLFPPLQLVRIEEHDNES